MQTVFMEKNVNQWKKNKKEKRKTDTSTHEFQNFFWTKTKDKLDSEDEHIYWKEGHFLELSFPYVQWMA